MYDDSAYHDSTGSEHLFGFDRGDWALLVGGCVLSTVLTFLI